MLPLPWALIGGFLAFLGAFCAGYASNDEAEAIQAAYERENARILQQRLARAQAIRESSEKLQAAADEERRSRDEKLKRMDADLRVALGELRKRPARGEAPRRDLPAPSGAPLHSCTGAELYRDDAGVLTREAARAQRILGERDACATLYGKAQAEIERLNRAAAESVKP